MPEGKYWHGIMKKLGWQDICVLFDITDPRQMHVMREYVLNGGKKKPNPFCARDWWRKSGLAPRWPARTNRPDKQRVQLYGTDGGPAG